MEERKDGLPSCQGRDFRKIFSSSQKDVCGQVCRCVCGKMSHEKKVSKVSCPCIEGKGKERWQKEKEKDLDLIVGQREEVGGMEEEGW